MISVFIEATNGPSNWGKFAVCRFEPYEWVRRSAVDYADRRPLLGTQGWTIDHLLVLDLATGEGAIFKPGGCAAADLNHKHQVWVCPLFEPFLEWLYQQDLADLSTLPLHVDLPDARFEVRGYRREGKPQAQT
jgi:hypothetical protein